MFLTNVCLLPSASYPHPSIPVLRASPVYLGHPCRRVVVSISEAVHQPRHLASDTRVQHENSLLITLCVSVVYCSNQGLRGFCKVQLVSCVNDVLRDN